jgi:hypothetical protein
MRLIEMASLDFEEQNLSATDLSPNLRALLCILKPTLFLVQNKTNKLESLPFLINKTITHMSLFLSFPRL